MNSILNFFYSKNNNYFNHSSFKWVCVKHKRKKWSKPIATKRKNNPSKRDSFWIFFLEDFILHTHMAAIRSLENTPTQSSKLLNLLKTGRVFSCLLYHLDRPKNSNRTVLKQLVYKIKIMKNLVI